MLEVKVKGMTCVGCAQSLHKALASTCSYVDVDVATGWVFVEPNEGVDNRQIIESIRRAGFKASNLENSKGEIANSRTVMIGTLVIGILHLIIHFILRGGHAVHMAEDGSDDETDFLMLLELLLALILLLLRWPLIEQGLQPGSRGMDTLISVSVVLSFVVSGVAVMMGWPWSFVETIPTMFLSRDLGKWMETLLKTRCTDTLDKLTLVNKQKVVLVKLSSEGSRREEILVEVEMLKQGDLVLVMSGQLIPIDGLVVEGNSWAEEVAVTGEADPCPKKCGDLVWAGTMNRGHPLLISAMRCGQGTLVGQVGRLCRRAQLGRGALQGWADWIAQKIFVPLVLLGGAMTGVIWILIDPSHPEQAIRHALAVISVACPCTLGLAVPMAVLVAKSIAAKQGILLKGDAVLPQSKRVKAVLLDKTGTLTEGKPSVTRGVIIHNHLDMTHDQLVSIIGTLEGHSDHPLAKAIRTWCKQEGKNNALNEQIGLSHVQVVQGCGLRCMVQGSRSMCIGSPAWVTEQHLMAQCIKQVRGPQPPMPPPPQQQLNPVQGCSVVATLDGVVVAMFWVEDQLRPEARAAVRWLKREQGFPVILITGDGNARATHTMAQALGIDEVYTGCTPLRKQQLIQEIGQRVAGKKSSTNQCLAPVAMIGDGLNDAAALANASIGIVMAGGADLTQSAASVVLLRPRAGLGDAITALDLSQTVYRRIKLNLGWACLYNTLSLPLAAGVLSSQTESSNVAISFLARVGESPFLCAILMAASSLSVVLSSVSLVWTYRAPKLQ